MVKGISYGGWNVLWWMECLIVDRMFYGGGNVLMAGEMSL